MKLNLEHMWLAILAEFGNSMGSMKLRVLSYDLAARPGQESIPPVLWWCHSSWGVRPPCPFKHSMWSICDQYVINMWSICDQCAFEISLQSNRSTMAYHGLPWPTIAHWPTRISACPLWPFSWGHQCTCRARCQETYPWSHQSPHLGTLIIWAAFDTSLKKNKIYDHTTINNLPICNECGCMHIYI